MVYAFQHVNAKLAMLLRPYKKGKMFLITENSKNCKVTKALFLFCAKLAELKIPIFPLIFVVENWNLEKTDNFKLYP